VVGFVTREGPFDARVLWAKFERDRTRARPFPGQSAWSRLWSRPPR